jgi:hypothetical protein
MQTFGLHAKRREMLRRSALIVLAGAAGYEGGVEPERYLVGAA